jgi:hypothetical protein
MNLTTTPSSSPAVGSVQYDIANKLPLGTSSSGGYAPATPPPPQTPAPATVVNSNAASNDLSNIQAQHADIVSGMSAQASSVASQKAQSDAAAAAQAQSDAQAKAAADKLAIDKQNADSKTAATSTQYPADTKVTADNTANQAALDAAKAQRDQANSDYQAATANVQTTISNIQSGAIPLSAGEQAQVDSLTQSFQTLISNQSLSNILDRGLANTRGYQTGAAEYDPSFQVKTIGSIVTGGLNKIADLNVKMAGAVAQLTQSFKTADIQATKDAWAMYQDASTKRIDALQTTINETNAAIKTANDTAYQQQQDALNYNVNLAKFNQQAQQNDFTQGLDTAKFAEQKKTDAFDQVYKTEDLQLKQRANAIAQQKISVPTVQTNASGVADAASQKAFLATLPPGTATAIQALTNYTMNPSSLSNRSVGGAPSQKQQMMTLAHQYDPSFDETQFNARAAYNKNITAGTLSTTIASANKAIAHLASFNDTVSSIGNGGLSALTNSWGNNLESIHNPALQSKLSQAQTQSAGVSSELAKFFKGSGATDVKSLEEWSNSLNINATPGQLKGMVQGAVTLMAGQIDALQTQYQNTMGKAPALGTFLQPDTMAKLSQLKNEGYDMPIKGVIYTDLNAYKASNPDASSALTNAYNTLKNAGYETSPENILQVAQIND